MQAELVSVVHARLDALTASRDALCERLDRARPKKGSRLKSGQWWRRSWTGRFDWSRYQAAELALARLHAVLGVPIPVVAD